MKNKIKIILFSSLAGLTVVLLLGYLGLIYVPTWYQPAYVTPTDQQKLRDDFDHYRDAFNNAMQKPLPFEFKITARDLNRFLAGVAYFDPGLRDAIPSNVREPAVQLDDDYLKIGAIVEQDGRKVFASFWLKVIPVGDWLVIDDLKVKIGLYRVPQTALKDRIEKISGKVAAVLPMIHEILDQGRCPNRFRYPNSDYDFRVLSLRARDGLLVALIEPIPREKQKS